MFNSPNACQPVGYEREGGHEEDEDGGAVLRVPVDLPGHPHQAEQAGRLEQADERRRLKARSKRALVSGKCGVVTGKREREAVFGSEAKGGGINGTASNEPERIAREQGIE